MEAEGRLRSRIERGPVVTGRFQQSKGADQVGLNKGRRTVDGAVHMAFGRQVHHDIRPEFTELLSNALGIGNIRTRERIARIVGHGGQRLEITCVSQAVHDADFILGILNNMTNDGRTNKPGATGDKDLHTPSRFSMSKMPLWHIFRNFRHATAIGYRNQNA